MFTIRSHSLFHGGDDVDRVPISRRRPQNPRGGALLSSHSRKLLVRPSSTRMPDRGMRDLMTRAFAFAKAVT